MSVLNDAAAKPGWWRQSGVQPQLLFGTALIALLLAMVIAPQLFSNQSPTAIDLAQALQPLPGFWGSLLLPSILTFSSLRAPRRPK